MAKILIVDDDQDIRRLLGIRLKANGHEPVFAGDAISAVDQGRNAVSAMDPKAHESRLAEVDADSFLQKPFDPDELLAAIERAPGAEPAAYARPEGGGDARPSARNGHLPLHVEGSTRLLKQLGEQYGKVIAEHQELLRAAFEEAGGQEIEGDSFFVAFPRAKDAVRAAITAQRALARYSWPEGASVRVRMGLHTGEPTVGDERYVGLGVHKAARIAAAAHGGQILLSNTTRGLVQDELAPDVHLLDLGEYRLKDIDLPDRIFQLNAEDLPDRFPPLRLEARLPEARRWRPPSWNFRRRPVIAAAVLALAAAVLGLALAMASHEANPAGDSGGGATSQRHTEPGEDANTIVAGNSIGAVRLGMTRSAVKAVYGPGAEAQWVSRGRNGIRLRYSAPAGSIVATFYDDKVVQVQTTSSYYSTANGVQVGHLAPDLNNPAALNAAVRRGELEEIEPGVYSWRGYVWQDRSNSFCLRGENAGTQILLRGFSGRITMIAITDARFLLHLPLHAALGASQFDFYCDVQPLEP
jgi:class 3 adenylate cyclase